MAHLVPVPRYVRERDGDRDRDRAVRLPDGRGLGSVNTTLGTAE